MESCDIYCVKSRLQNNVKDKTAFVLGLYVYIYMHKDYIY